MTWIKLFGYKDLSNSKLYIVSVYWSVTTLTTVGYGDISATNDAERYFSIAVMIIGILCYSYIISSVSSIFSEIDSKHSVLDSKLNSLFEISKNVKINPIFYSKLTIFS